MPLDEGETLSRVVQQLRSVCIDISAAIAELGTTRDAVAREKLRKARRLATRCEARANSVLSAHVDVELAHLRQQYDAVKAEFDVINKEATRREKQTWRPCTQETLAGEKVQETGKGTPSVTPGPVREQEIKTIDMSAFQTEEAFQRERLLGLREIEGNMLELKTTYQEFQDLVYQQQAHLDNVAGNVQVSKTSVGNATNQLRHASRRQGCCRRLLCAFAMILFILFVVVIVVVLIKR